MRPVKVVYSMWDRRKSIHQSVNMGQVGINYIPGEWARPWLPGTRLFLWDSLMNAIMFHGLPRYASAYMGISYWWAEGLRIKKMEETIKDPTVDVALMFWQNWLYGWGLANIPYIYKWTNQPVGVLSADEVRLVSMVETEELEQLKGIVKVDYRGNDIKNKKYRRY